MNHNHSHHCRIFTDIPLNDHADVVLSAEQAHYLRNVMRLAAGANVTLFNGYGGEYDAEVTRLDKSGACCTLATQRKVNREMPCRIHIVQAACRSEKIEHVLQKGTELGAASFSIVRSERSALKLDGNKLDVRLARWRKIIVEAAEQSGRTRLPEVNWYASLDQAPATGRALVLHPEAATPWQAMRTELRDMTDISLAVGPEGGFSERDLRTLATSGFQPLAFGPRIMRTETASPALLAAIAAII